MDAPLRALLHPFLSGTRDGLTVALVERAGANGFFVHGPRAIRRLRVRNHVAAGPLSRDQFEVLVAVELEAAIGTFTRPAPRTAEDDALGRRAHPWARG